LQVVVFIRTMVGEAAIDDSSVVMLHEDSVIYFTLGRRGMIVGTYMSAFIEVDHGDRSPPFSDPAMVQSLSEGSFSFGKDYDVFDALAGGREASMAPEDRDPSRGPLFAPRGMPSPCSQAVGWDYFYLIAEPSSPPDRYFWPAWRCVTPDLAAEWVQAKGCHEAEFLQTVNCGPPTGQVWRVVSAPGLYNASWLRFAEFDAALAHQGLDPAKIPVEYRIIRAAMSLLSERRDPQRVRLVVWFR
jgi:hypothetical protein